MQNVLKFAYNKFNKRVINYFFYPQRLPWTIIGFGILVRLAQYLYNRSLWNDEAALALNIVNRSYFELLQPLNYDQGAPIGFLLVEKLAVQLFGDNEYALRLFPLLSAIISLFIFYELAKRCLQPQAVTIALALFSTLHIWVEYASEVKQYSTDVLTAVLSCLLFMHMDSKKLTFTQIAIFCVVGAIVIWFSHPAIFVLAGVGTSCLLLSLFKKNLLISLKLLGVYSIWVLSFAIFYSLSLKNLANKEDLFNSWESRGTFPSSVLDINWLFTTFVYFFHKPLGFPDIFLSLAIFAFIVGCLSIFFKRKATLLILLSPVLVTFLAAYLHKYPFDGRLVLFLIPFITLLIGEGAAVIWHKTRYTSLRKVGILVLVLLLVPPLGTAGYLTVIPYLKQEIRPVISYVKAHQQAGDIIYVYQRAEYQFKYYANKFGYREGDYIIGIDDLDKKDGQGISEEEWQRYTSDLDKLRGNKRVWIIFSHVRSWAHESERITSYLDSFGKQLDVFKRKGSFVYLYDLTKF